MNFDDRPCGLDVLLLLKAAELIQQREEAGADSDSDMLVPQTSYTQLTQPWNHGVASRCSASDASSSDDDSLMVPQQHRPPAKPSARAAVASLKPVPRGPMQHNEVEKRRRAYLSACYTDLKALLPSIAETKASNVCILRTAANTISGLASTEKELEAELAQLRQQRARLLAVNSSRSHGLGAATDAAVDLSPVSSVASDEMVVPDSSERSVSPEIEENLTYAYSHDAKIGVYPTVKHHGGGALRRRARVRPARFL